MKWIVGYPISENKEYLETVIRNRDRISEVYFSWADLPNGRSILSGSAGETPFELVLRQTEDLKRLSDAGIGLNLLYNANCYGKDSQSRAFFLKIGDLTDYIRRSFGLASVTTSSPLIAKFLRENFRELEIRGSVNLAIGTEEELSYLEDLFDSFYVKRELNRDRKALERLRSLCDAMGKQMFLLANSGCLNNCTARTFHDNLVAHEAEISAMDNGYQFNGLCHVHLAKEGNWETWLQRTNFIRPEDVALYEGLTPAMKLATRVSADPVRILTAYLEGAHTGSVMELLEPNHSRVIFPRYIDNGEIAPDFGKRVMTCDKNCTSCGYCKEVIRKACVLLGDDPSVKL